MRVFSIRPEGFERKVLRVVLPVLVGLLGCSSQVSGQENRDTSETEGYVRRLFATNLDRPQAVVPISDSTVLVAERSGRVLFLDGDQRTDLGLINVPGMHIFYVADPPYTEGLKDLILIPDRAGELLWCVTTGSAEAVRWTVGRTTLDMKQTPPITMKNEILWQSTPQAWIQGPLPPFSGCRLAVEQDDVDVAMGANHRKLGSGRIMQISISNRHVPPVVSTGHRNPGGIVRNDGILWEVEFGPTGGDELNIIVTGGNYGWPAVSKGKPDDDEEPRSFLGTRPGSIDPVVYWVPSINPASLTAWRGKLYIGALTGTVIELRVKGNQVISQERILELGERIRDVRPSHDGKLLWVLTDGPDAQLFQVVPAVHQSASSQ